MIDYNSEIIAEQIHLIYVNSIIKRLNEDCKERNTLIDKFIEKLNLFKQNSKRGDLREWLSLCKDLQKSIGSTEMIVGCIKHLLTYSTNHTIKIVDYDAWEKEVVSNENVLSLSKRFLSELESLNYLTNVEDIINIYHKFYDNEFNAQLKPNDYKPIFSKTIDNNLFEVVLVIPELSISKDEYNCISISVFINGELDSPIFDLTQLNEVFSFINNYNV